MSDDLFESAKALVRWAGEEISTFNDAANAFAENCKAKSFAYPDHLTGEGVHGYEIVTKPPEELRKLGYRIINDLRNALDQAVHAASLVIGTDKPTKTNFPVAETPDGIERRLLAPSCAGIPIELHDKIKSFRAYWPGKGYSGGNVFLRALLEAANPNKHRFAVSAGVSQNGLDISALSPNVTVRPRNVGDNKVELFRVPFHEKFEVKMNVKFIIMLEGCRGYGGLPATMALDLTCREVWKVVSDLEIEAFRLASLK